MRRVSSTISALASVASSSSFNVNSASVSSSTGVTSSSALIQTTHTHQVRLFSTNGRMTNEYAFGTKLADIPVLTGKDKPLTRDGEWTCSYALTERMESVVPKILRRHGFAEAEVRRECGQLFDNAVTTRVTSWVTVEDFQKTPWFRRFRPADSTACVMVSYECMKVLEAELVPPSLRNDPYSALRKRHMEDQFTNDKFSEIHAKSVRREDLARHTKGMPQYGQVTRKSFMEFNNKFRDAQGGSMNNVDDAYHAWLATVSKDANHVGKN